MMQSEVRAVEVEANMKRRPLFRGWAPVPGGKALVFWVFLVSGLLVTAARLVSPFEVGKDQSLQLEAAVRLANGFGLTTAYASNQPADVSEASTPKYLTWWPPALSVLVAGFLHIGFSLTVSLKIIYAATTIIGWAGWASVASHLLSKPVTLWNRVIRVELLFAAVCPILYTPSWGAAPTDGTDIFLWAGVPLVVMLMFRLGSRRASNVSVLLAGLICGVLYAFRYASLFLCLAATLMIFQMTFPYYKRFVWRCFLFACSTAAVFLPTLAYVRTHSSRGSFLPEYVDLASTLEAGKLRILDRLAMSTDMIFAFPTIERFIYLVGSSLFIRVCSIACLLVIIALPLAILKSRRADGDGHNSQFDLSLSVSFLPLSLIVFSISATFCLGWSPLGHSRYYVPVLLCFFFIAYEVFTARVTHPVVKGASAAIVTLFFVHVFVYTPILSLTPNKKADLVRAVLSFTPHRNAKYTSTSLDIGFGDYRVYSVKENSRRKLKELHETNPDAIFFVDPYSYYAYDSFWYQPSAAGSVFRYLPGLAFWKQAYSSRPIKVFWFVSDLSDHRVSLITFTPESNLKPIFFDSIEKTQVFESDFPAGHRFFSD